MARTVGGRTRGSRTGRGSSVLIHARHGWHTRYPPIVRDGTRALSIGSRQTSQRSPDDAKQRNRSHALHNLMEGVDKTPRPQRQRVT